MRLLSIININILITVLLFIEESLWSVVIAGIRRWHDWDRRDKSLLRPQAAKLHTQSQTFPSSPSLSCLISPFTTLITVIIIIPINIIPIITNIIAIIISFIKSSPSVITKMHNLSKLITKPKPNVAALFSFKISFFLWSHLTLTLDMAPF